MDCGETSMRLTHQNRLKHLVPSLSHTGVNQDTHMLGACHASFNHINIRALVSTISTSRPYDLTCFCTSKKLLQEPNEVNYGERCCESVFLQERIEVNASDTPKTYHECYCYTPDTPPHPRANRLPESTLQILSLWGSCVLLLLFDRARKCANMIHLLNGVACLQKQTVHSGWIPWRWGSVLSWPAWQQLIKCCP